MEDDYDDDILRYALKGAQQHEKMSGANQRAKDAFFDGKAEQTKRGKCGRTHGELKA